MSQPEDDFLGSILQYYVLENHLWISEYFKHVLLI